MVNITRVILVAQSSRIHDGLRAVLRTIPGIEMMGQVEDGLSALKAVAQYSPMLVLLDANLPDDPLQTLLKPIKINWPQTCCIVLVSNIKQQQVARMRGADEVLLAGFSATCLLNTIQTLVAEQKSLNSETT
jgi:DNA-binding NarL/FixJ family response regulator